MAMDTQQPQRCIEAALEIARDFGQFDGDHHRLWVIDQMVRALTGDGYDRWVSTVSANPYDPSTPYEWDTGIAP